MSLEPVPEDWSRALAVVAHPDDLEYGAASAIARWTDQGKWVGYVLATSGEAGIDALPPDEAARLRQDEERRSARGRGRRHAWSSSPTPTVWSSPRSCSVATSPPRSAATGPRC